MVFSAADADGDGTLDVTELRALAMSLGVTADDELRSAVAQMDDDGDGEVSVEEFLRWWEQQAEEHKKRTEGGALLLRVPVHASCLGRRAGLRSRACAHLHRLGDCSKASCARVRAMHRQEGLFRGTKRSTAPRLHRLLLAPALQAQFPSGTCP